MSGLAFDPTISAGNILTLLFGVVALAVAWTKIGGRLDMVEYRVKSVEETLKIIATVLEKFTMQEKGVALIDQRVVALEVQTALLEKTIDELRRGIGWITRTPRDTSSLEGEY